MENTILKNGRELIIRKVISADAEQIVAYLHAIGSESDYLTFNSQELNLNVEDERSFIDSIAGKGNSVMAVAIIDDQPVGLISFMGGARSRVSHVGEMGLSVRKPFWGLGIGGLLITWLIQWAKQTNIVRKINLCVRTDNERAIALYRRFGFAGEGTLTRDFFIDGIFYDSYAMGLTIDSKL